MPALRTATRLLLLGLCLACAFGGMSLLRPGPAEATISAFEVPRGYARIVVIGDHDVVEVKINGVSYPYEYLFGSQEGLLVPSGRHYEIIATVGEDKRRTFRFHLDDRETRVLVVDITNMGEQIARPARVARGRADVAERQRTAAEDGDEEDEDRVGYLGVSSSPRGIVYVDGRSTGQRTPARRLEVEPGRREVRVLYDGSGELSDPRHVLIRPGVNTNVFFREPRE